MKSPKIFMMTQLKAAKFYPVFFFPTNNDIEVCAVYYFVCSDVLIESIKMLTL